MNHDEWTRMRHALIRQVGVFDLVAVNMVLKCGTVKDKDGRGWDWWIEDDGSISIALAR